MNTRLPFTNWSLKKALATQPDGFSKARLHIMFTILVFSMVKSAIAIVQFSVDGHKLQLIRAAIAGTLYLALTKVLLSRPSAAKKLAHFMLVTAVLIVWTSIFIFSHRVNLITGQFIMMIALCSFYTLGNRLGFIYTAISVLPAVLLFVLQGFMGLMTPLTEDQAHSPGFELIVTLNFVSIAVGHFLFYRAFADNIREKDRLNAQLQDAIEEARKLADSRSNFLSTMSHELRTPLNSVVGMAELLIEDQPTERQRENLQVLHSSAIDLLSLINNVLDFNKIDANKMELERVSLDLNRFLDDLTRGFRNRAHDKRLEFKLQADPALTGVQVCSDPTRLAQVMYNLLSNALKFTESGGITVSAECTGRTDDTVTVLFSVTDTGIGIPANRHGAIFEVFTQVAPDTARNYGGSGLGLAIVKQVLHLFGSTIRMESIPGQGSCFQFAITFPVTISASASQKPSETQHEIGHLRILVAEDDKVNRLIIKKQLARLNLDAEVVENGQLAYEACLARPFDVVLLDLHMPVMNGYETIQQVRTLAGSRAEIMHIIAFTAAVTEQEQIAAAGFDDFLYKPVQLTDLQEKLQRAAGRGKSILP